MGIRNLIPAHLGGDIDNVFNRWPFYTGRFMKNYREARKPIWDYVEEYKPRTILEMGLGEGLNAVKILEIVPQAYYCAFDVLDPSYFREKPRRDIFLKNLTILAKKKNFHLVVGDSKCTLPDMVDRLPKMDLIYIDGGHDLPTVKSDWENARKLMHDGTTVFFDDCQLDGIGQVIDGIDRGRYSVEGHDSSRYRVVKICEGAKV